MESVNQRIVRGVLAVGWASATVKILGLADQIVITRTFGTGPSMDALNAAWALPLLLSLVFATTIETTLVPIYIRARQSGEPEAADRVLSSLINLCALLFGSMSVLGAVFAPALVRVSAPGLHGERLEIAVALAGFLYPIVTAHVLACLIMGALSARKAFSVPALVNGAVPVTILLAVILLGSRFGIVALAAGQLVGFLIQLAIFVAVARRVGVRYHFVIDLRSEQLRDAGRQSVIVLAGSMLAQVNVFVDQVVASTLPPGGLSSLNYALKLMDLPVVVVFGAFARSALPHFSEQVAVGDWLGLRSSVRLVTWLMLAVTLPMTLGAILLARPVIGLLFQRGNFTALDTAAVATVFTAAVVGAAPLGLSYVIARVFNAMQRNWYLTVVTVSGIGLNAALDLALAPRWGAAGIALSTSTVSAAAVVLQLALLGRLPGGFNALGIPVQGQMLWRRIVRELGAEPARPDRVVASPPASPPTGGKV